jgi:mannose-1-phosphate guanylyltransferase
MVAALLRRGTLRRVQRGSQGPRAAARDSVSVVEHAAKSPSPTESPAISKDPVVVIMAGGAGTRFWPASTERRPKQFLRLLGDQSLLEESFARALRLTSRERILVLTNAAFVPLVSDQLPGLPEANIVGEPLRRDTAAAVCLGAVICGRRFGDCAMAVLTADHVISPPGEFDRSLRSALQVAASVGALYTFGIPPSYPATGYGYLERGPLVLHDGGVRHYHLERFHEKPDSVTAADYLASGNHYWNSGMFVWRTSAISAEFERQLPAHIAAIGNAVSDEGEVLSAEAMTSAFEALEAVSVDHGIMEGAADVRMIAATFSWSDVGGWVALEGYLPVDGEGNRHRGRLAARDSARNVVFAEDGEELVALLGVEDLVVVRAGRRTLVASRDRLEDVKLLVRSLAELGYTDDM